MASIRIGLILIFCAASVFSQGPDNLKVYKICATEKYASQCNQLQRGKSEVICQRVQDSLECAKRLLNQTADFGMFSAESTLHISTLGWGGMTVIKRLVHKERQLSPVDFESVVVVKSDYTGGIEALKGKRFCHPGLHYGKQYRWSEQFYKHFERTIIPISSYKCQSNMTPVEIEIAALASQFGKSCYPGKWSHDAKEDIELKRKYPRLCELCDPLSKNCDYPKGSQGPNSNHQSALNCLKQGGDVAYVTRQDAEYFFKENDQNQYRYLCPNGTLEKVLSSNTPCVWLRQPWGVIMASIDIAHDVEDKINKWIQNQMSGAWEAALKEILETDSYVPSPVTRQFPADYINPFRRIPYSEPICNAHISWCTISPEEHEKCQVIRAAGMTAGVYPYVTCRAALLDTMECLNDISKNRSDFMGIDSNFGFMARRLFDLTPAMYFETEVEQYSSVVVVTHANSKFKKFKDLKGAKACLPEFGATPTIAFINLGKELKFFRQNECRYGRLLKEFFGPSCAPGASDMKRDLNKRDLSSQTNTSESEPLCKLCLNEDLRESSNIGMDVEVSTGGTISQIPNKVTCSAEESNRYYGNRGALRCLHESGDVAIVELQSLKEHAAFLGLDDNKFQIMCRNGTIVPGFKVDQGCALTTIVDGEIITRRNTSKLSWIIHALMAFDSYFQVDPDLKMYNIFNSKKHLLFKDSTIGLTSVHETAVSTTVENYIKLFKNTEDCVQGNAGTTIIINITTTILLVLTTIFMSH